MTPRKSRKNLYGFTLIELLVSIFIIALISGIFMVNYHNINKRSELKMAAQKLASDIRLAQNYSLGSKTYNGINTPPGGWGVHLALAGPSNYIIFADQAETDFPNGDKTYDDGEAMEIKTLPAGATIDSIEIGGTPNPLADIVFFPPDPQTYINGSGANSARIILKENLNNSTAAVTVNFFGLIDTE